MDPTETSDIERVLVLSEASGPSRGLRASLAAALPDIEFDEVGEMEGLRTKISSADFDLVVLDADLHLEDYRHLICELKNHERQPSVVVVAENNDPSLINELYKSGCSRCILRGADLARELPAAIKAVLRIRQLEDENIKIRTQLTEANIMLDERNKRLDEFSATVAHDIRGPLGAISMKLEYALDLFGDNLDPKCENLLRRSFNATGRLTKILQVMYDFARLGAQAAKMKAVDLNALLSEVGEDMEFKDRPMAKIEADDLPVVWGSPELLRRVFMNIIGNAIKYSGRPDPMVSIIVDGELENAFGRFCRIRVEDNGPGIPEKELPLVFSMFSRGSNAALADEESSPGMGVGLAVVQRIVELHHGSIEARSELGQGAQFIFTLPLEEFPQSARESD